jgi:hypothetical protein
MSLSPEKQAAVEGLIISLIAMVVIALICIL